MENGKRVNYSRKSPKKSKYKKKRKTKKNQKAEISHNMIVTDQKILTTKFTTRRQRCMGLFFFKKS